MNEVVIKGESRGIRRGIRKDIIRMLRVRSVACKRRGNGCIMSWREEWIYMRMGCI